MKKILLLIFCCALECHVCIAQQGEWTWMKGDSTWGSAGVFGTIGVPSIANVPPAMYEPCEWVDHDGNLWLYGGNVSGITWNALWKYDPLTNEWAWMHGSSLGSPMPVFGTQGVADPNNTPGGRSWGIATWTDSLNNLWLFGGYHTYGGYIQDLWKYNIPTNEWTWVKGSSTPQQPGIYGVKGVPAPANNPGGRYETAASWTDDANNLWLFGGYGVDASGSSGSLNDLWMYNIATNEWMWVAGESSADPAGSYGVKGVPDPSNEPPGRMPYCRWKDAHGNFWLFGGGNYFTNAAFNDVWKYDLSTAIWTWINGSSVNNDAGIYDSLCTSSQNIYPLAKSETRASWTTDNGCLFWLFGGISFSNYYGDFWAYIPDSNKFILVGGSASSFQPSHYGTKGVSNASNYPQTRKGSAAWTDHDGSLWMLGGFMSEPLNDMWRYVPNPACPSISDCAQPLGQVNFSATDTSICEKFCIGFFDSSLNNPLSWQWFFPGGDPSSSADQNPANICYQDPGTFDVTLITTNGAGISDTLQLNNYITVYSNPFGPVITQTGNVLTSTPADTYQWQLNSLDIPGATNQSYIIVLSGLYTVVISDENGCKAQASIDAFVGISGVEEDSYLTIFPNPSSGSFIVEVMNEKNPGEISIDVFNTLGQKVFSSLKSRPTGTADRKVEIDLRDVAPGVYFLEIKTGNGIIRKKIVIAH